MKTLLCQCIFFYQRWISPMTPPSCVHYPSCSSYAMEAIERFGMLRGGCMAVWRVLRCNRWSSKLIDPVPHH